jgi:hypothetical protein
MKATLDKFLAKGTQITSIKENQTGSFVIFPNPTNGHLHIENKSNETSEFKLLNLMGINLLEIPYWEENNLENILNDKLKIKGEFVI